MIDLTNKVVVVTGGSRGIGASIVRVVAAAGGDVVVHYGRSRAAAEAVVRDLDPRRYHLVESDLERADGAMTLWSAALRWQGRVDVLVNNAAIALEVDLSDAAAWLDAWDRTWRVNVRAVAELCRAAIVDFRERGGGTIINIASRAAFRGDGPEYFHYAASKGAVVALTKSIARAYARDGVIAYAVAPGWVRTEMAEQAIRMHGEATLTRDIPMGSMAPPDEVANIVAFLASGLARHATGSTIDINGASYVR